MFDRSLSLDGKSLTIQPLNFDETPDVSGRTKVYARRSGTNGFAGRWQDTAPPLSSRPKILDVALNGGRLHLAFPELGQHSDPPIDGSVVPTYGPSVSPGAGISVKAISPREFSVEYVFSGRVIRKGTISLSGDGRTLLRESWATGDPDQSDRLVYDKE
jgi:hypothetical protein